jgi:hypothetical protein
LAQGDRDVPLDASTEQKASKLVAASTQRIRWVAVVNCSRASMQLLGHADPGIVRGEVERIERLDPARLDTLQKYRTHLPRLHVEELGRLRLGRKADLHEARDFAPCIGLKRRLEDRVGQLFAHG